MAAVAARSTPATCTRACHEAGGRRDEIRVLADSFNHMLDRLSDAFAGQRAFVADASHELRTPLTVIRGQLEVLGAQPDDVSQEVQRVERLVRARSSRISRLVDDLLLLAQSDRAALPARRARSTCANSSTELWEGVRLTADRRFECGADPRRPLRADPDRLAQALRNLARNAIEHTAPGDGLVRLSSSRRRAAACASPSRTTAPGSRRSARAGLRALPPHRRRAQPRRRGRRSRAWPSCARSRSPTPAASGARASAVAARASSSSCPATRRPRSCVRPSAPARAR